ncbi:hypothetical protein CVT26_006145 [Gymnopilus dilepis]|uniref:Uncharacterized protein n=1 Tax=Gymnopilus dilepis TaxID=231916 RepID=A0A409X4R3_9AGAR|nr:hypothetical protein CVT26_006145 [Gymnopilus dilepis]
MSAVNASASGGKGLKPGEYGRRGVLWGVASYVEAAWLLTVCSVASVGRDRVTGGLTEVLVVSDGFLGWPSTAVNASDSGGKGLRPGE